MDGTNSNGNNGNDDGNVAVATPSEEEGKDKAQISQPSFRSRQESQDTKKEIEDIIKDLFQDAMSKVEDNPEEAIKVYKQAEYLALSKGKGATGKAMVWIGQQLSMLSFDTQIKKENKELEGAKDDYQKIISKDEKKLEKTSKALDDLRSNKDKSYKLGDLIEDQVATEQADLVELDTNYQDLKQEPKSKDSLKQMDVYRKEATKKKSYIQQLEAKKTKNTIYSGKLDKQINGATKRRELLRDRINKHQMEMYDVIEDQAPTGYLVSDIEAFQEAYAVSVKAKGTRNRLKNLSAAAEGANAGLEAAMFKISLQSDSSDDGSKADPELESQRELYRNKSKEKVRDREERYVESKRIYHETDSLLNP